MEWSKCFLVSSPTPGAELCIRKKNLFHSLLNLEETKAAEYSTVVTITSLVTTTSHSNVSYYGISIATTHDVNRNCYIQEVADASYVLNGAIDKPLSPVREKRCFSTRELTRISPINYIMSTGAVTIS